MLLVAAGLRLCFALSLPTAPMSDFQAFYQAAEEMRTGSLSWTHVYTSDDYFYRWAYQIPFTLYEAGILSICPSIVAVKLADVLWMTLSVFPLYGFPLGHRVRVCVCGGPKRHLSGKYDVQPAGFHLFAALGAVYAA